jgi:copper homeostasis protein (lipoprotein)
MKFKRVLVFSCMLLMGCSCNRSGNTAEKHIIYKGLYSYGPEVRSFKECESGNEYWVTDSSATLELKYSQLNFEKPYEPVYVEVEGKKIKTSKADGLDTDYDSILVVKKLIKITKEVPQDMCN